MTLVWDYAKGVPIVSRKGYLFMTRNINRDVCGWGERVQSKNNGCSAGLQSFVFHDAGVAMWVDPNEIRFLNTQFKDRSCLIDPLRIED